MLIVEIKKIGSGVLDSYTLSHIRDTREKRISDCSELLYDDLYTVNAAALDRCKALEEFHSRTVCPRPEMDYVTDRTTFNCGIINIDDDDVDFRKNFKTSNNRLSRFNWDYRNKDSLNNTLHCRGYVCVDEIRVGIDNNGTIFEETSFELFSGFQH